VTARANREHGFGDAGEYMAGFLDEYGVADARRERTVKYVVIGVVIAAILGLSAFFFFRNRSEERVADAFLAALRNKNYQEGYGLWGCTPKTPCPYYSPERFVEDWGAAGTYKNPESMKVEHVDACDTGVVFDLSYPGANDQGLWVERKTKVLSYAPWPRCPGPHLQVIEYLKSRLGGGSK
jgi:hypothetical protein